LNGAEAKEGPSNRSEKSMKQSLLRGECDFKEKLESFLKKKSGVMLATHERKRNCGVDEREDTQSDLGDLDYLPGPERN